LGWCLLTLPPQLWVMSAVVVVLLAMQRVGRC
jgi:hypothetical protein